MIKAIGGDVVSAWRTPVGQLLAARSTGPPMTSPRAAAARYQQGAVTNVQVMGEAEVRALLAPVGLDELLEVVVTSTAVGVEKPDPRGVLHALESLGVAPNEALFVGDEDADAGAAAAAGVAFARVDATTTAAGAMRRMTEMARLRCHCGARRPLSARSQRRRSPESTAPAHQAARRARPGGGARCAAGGDRGRGAPADPGTGGGRGVRRRPRRRGSRRHALAPGGDRPDGRQLRRRWRRDQRPRPPGRRPCHRRRRRRRHRPRRDGSRRRAGAAASQRASRHRRPGRGARHDE